MDWERYNQLIALSEADKKEKALAGFQDLFHLSETSEDKGILLLAIGGRQRELGRMEDARRTFAQILDSGEYNAGVKARALYIDASLSMDDGSQAQALRKLEALLRDFSVPLQDPENEDLLQDVRRNQGIALYELGRKEEARPLLEGSAQVEYKKATSLYYLGRCSYDLGDFNQTKEALRAALKLDLHPVYQPSAHYVLGLACHWSGQSAWAIREFEWCLEHDKHGLEKKWKVLTALVSACKAVGQEEEARHYSRMLTEARR